MTARPKKKYYVVWEGRLPGIYLSWDECKAQTEGFPTAKFKSFETQKEAETAFSKDWKTYQKEKYREEQLLLKSSGMLYDKPILESISVDAAWNSVTKDMEYRGVYTRTGQLLFHQGPFQGATNNIGEFLAIIHGLAYLQQKNNNMPIYTDSITAISWVRNKKHKSVLAPTEQNQIIFELLQRAENWLANNYFTNRIIKWNTKVWGEIPADFGRK